MFRLAGAIANQFPGLGDPFKLPVDAAYMWALQSRAIYYDHLNDQLRMSTFLRMTPEASHAYSSGIATLASGPGKHIPWEETLSPELRQAMADVDREVAETIARRKARGKIRPDQTNQALGRKGNRNK